MSASERIDKFYADCFALPKSRGKECEKISIWLQKHQSEIVPSGQQTKLVQLVDQHFRSGREDYPDKLLNLIQTMLSLPEGKLITAKSKQKILKFLEALAPSKPVGISSATTVSTYSVIDIDESSGSIVVVDDSDDTIILENVNCNPDLLNSLTRALQAESDIFVTINPEKNFIAKAYYKISKEEIK